MIANYVALPFSDDPDFGEDGNITLYVRKESPSAADEE
jgi:hypothetical protein